MRASRMKSLTAPSRSAGERFDSLISLSARWPCPAHIHDEVDGALAALREFALDDVASLEAVLWWQQTGPRARRWAMWIGAHTRYARRTAGRSARPPGAVAGTRDRL